MVRQQCRSFPLVGLAASFFAEPLHAFVSQPHSTLGSQRPSLVSLLSTVDLDRPLVAKINYDNLLVQELQDVYPLLGATDLSSLETEIPTLEYLERAGEDSVSMEGSLQTHVVTESSLQNEESPSVSSLSPPRSFDSTLRLWKRRLVTRQDSKHLHKITGILFLLSSFGLTGYGIRDMLAHGWTQPVNNHGKPFFSLIMVLLGSSVLQSFSSISMACQYRRSQPAVRNTFLCNAAVAILGSFSALWSAPWYPTALNGAPGKAFYLIMDAIGLIGMGDNLIRLNALIASRQTRKGNKNLSGLHYWKDVFVYMMPILIGAPFFVGIGWQFGIRHDRTFYLDLLRSKRYPHLEAGAVYGMVMVAMGASYSSLIVTLRDKKLISKRSEGLSLTAVMLCLIASLYQALRDPGAIAALLGL